MPSQIPGSRVLGMGILLASCADEFETCRCVTFGVYVWFGGLIDAYSALGVVY